MEEEERDWAAERAAYERVRAARGGTDHDHDFEARSRRRNQRCTVLVEERVGPDRWVSKPCGKPATSPLHRKWRVNVYALDRCYGGPEEGGWWYDTEDPELSLEVPASRYGDAVAIAGALEAVYPDRHSRSSVAYSDGDYDVRVERWSPRYSPSVQPRYE